MPKLFMQRNAPDFSAMCSENDQMGSISDCIVSSMLLTGSRKKVGMGFAFKSENLLIWKE